MTHSCKQTKELLADYINQPQVHDEIDKYIVPSTWGNDAGIVGALTLAKVALDGKRE